MSGPQTRLRPAATGRRDRTNNTSVANHITDTSTSAQRERLLAKLRRQAITTIDARCELNVMHPAMRVKELRERGHDIVTRLVDIPDDHGRLHRRVALYSLAAGGAK